jgi:hypothetical protein
VARAGIHTTSPVACRNALLCGYRKGENRNRENDVRRQRRVQSEHEDKHSVSPTVAIVALHVSTAIARTLTMASTITEFVSSSKLAVTQSSLITH